MEREPDNVEAELDGVGAEPDDHDPKPGSPDEGRPNSRRLPDAVGETDEDGESDEEPEGLPDRPETEPLEDQV